MPTFGIIPMCASLHAGVPAAGSRSITWTSPGSRCEAYSCWLIPPLINHGLPYPCVNLNVKAHSFSTFDHYFSGDIVAVIHADSVDVDKVFASG